MSERRAYSRTNLRLPVTVRIDDSPNEEVICRSQIEDFSVEGFRVGLPRLHRLEVGRSLDFEIDTIRSPKTIKAQGRLCWIKSIPGDRANNEVGIRLVNMKPEDWDQWLHLMLTQNFSPGLTSP